MTRPGGSQAGLTLLEVFAALIIGGIALTVFMHTLKPTINSNNAARKHIDVSGALAEILDSTMTLPVSTLDGMNNSVHRSRQGVQVRLNVSAFSQAGADGILAGLDISRMRTLKVTAVSDTARKMTATVSNYNDIVGARCYD